MRFCLYFNFENITSCICSTYAFSNINLNAVKIFGSKIEFLDFETIFLSLSFSSATVFVCLLFIFLAKSATTNNHRNGSSDILN